MIKIVMMSNLIDLHMWSASGYESYKNNKKKYIWTIKNAKVRLNQLFLKSFKQKFQSLHNFQNSPKPSIKAIWHWLLNIIISNSSLLRINLLFY